MKKAFNLFISLLSLITLFSCNSEGSLKNKMIIYYSLNDNYVKIDAKIQHIMYGNSFDDVIIYFLVDNLDSSTPAIYSTRRLLVNWSEIKCDINVGDDVTFTTAEKTFNEKYLKPVISIEKENKVLLPLEQGKENYLNWINKTFD